MTTPAEQYDTIVVGAGFAGAAAARELAVRGRRVLVVEGRDRVGGRTMTSAMADGTLVELGGTFVHWFQPHTWSEITRYGLVDEVVTGLEPAGHVLMPTDDGMRWTTAEAHAERERALLDRFFADAREELPRPYQPGFAGAPTLAADARTVADRFDELDLGPGDRALLEAWFTGHTGVPADRSSYLSELRVWAPAGNDYVGMLEASFGYRLRRGTVSLIEAILADGGAEVRLDSPVAAIEVTANDGTVVLDDGQRLQAGSVVLAVPSGAWQDLHITPPLDDARLVASAEGMQAPHVIKGYLRVRGESRAVSIMPALPHPISILTTAHRISSDEQLMVFWASVHLAAPYDRAGLDAAVRTLLPDARVTEVQARLYSREERFTRGAWGVLQPGQLARFAPDEAFAKPRGRLFFASSDIATGWTGYIDGAIESGLRAARQVLAEE